MYINHTRKRLKIIKMKTLLIVLSISFANFTFSQTKTVEIKTSAECGMCKKKIEETLNYTKGVKFAELDMSTKVVTVKYSEDKISLDKIRETLSEIGYSADDVKANPEAVEKLPACCKPGGMKH